MPVLLLVRHARAGARGHGPDDLARPLDERGEQQAAALPGLLIPLLTTPAVAGAVASGPASAPHIASSPARRCIDTVTSLAKALGTSVAVDAALAEASDVRVLHDRFAELTRPTVWASHGDVIPDLLAMLARRGLDLGPAPRCQKGSTWVIEIEAGAAVRSRYLPPPG